MAIRASGEITFQDVKRGTSAVSRAGSKKFTLPLAAILSMLLGFLMWKQWPSDNTFSLLVIFYGVFLGLWIWLAPTYAAWRTWNKNPNARGHHEYEFDETGLKSKWANGQSDLRWNGFVKWQETEDLLLVYVRPRAAQIIPKRFFASSLDIEAARALIGANLTKK